MDNRTFTEEERRQLKDKYAESSLARLAQEFHTSTLRVRKELMDLGVAIRGKGRPGGRRYGRKKTLKIFGEE